MLQSDEGKRFIKKMNDLSYMTNQLYEKSVRNKAVMKFDTTYFFIFHHL